MQHTLELKYDPSTAKPIMWKAVFQKRSTAMRKSSSWSFFFLYINAFIWSSLETRILYLIDFSLEASNTLWERQRGILVEGNFDVEYTLILRWKMLIRWTDTFQRRIHVDSTSKFTLRLVRWIFTSNRRRFYVKKYLSGHGIFFNVESTSILLGKVSVQTWYCFHVIQRRFNVEVSLSTRTVDSSTSNIRRFHVDASPTVFVDFPTLNAHRFNVDISQ